MTSYQTINGISYINGKNGPYENKITDPSVRYGRNAVANYFSYLKDYKLPPLDQDVLDFTKDIASASDEEFEKRTNALSNMLGNSLKTMNDVSVKFSQKYLPEEKVDPRRLNTMALLGAAFEELGKRTAVSVNELGTKAQAGINAIFTSGSSSPVVGAQVLDLNDDGQVDIGEYASSILLADMLSTDENRPKPENVTGEINNQGQNASLAYYNSKNSEPAKKTFDAIHKEFKLENAKNIFISNANNTVQ